MPQQEWLLVLEVSLTDLVWVHNHDRQPPTFLHRKCYCHLPAIVQRIFSRVSHPRESTHITQIIHLLSTRSTVEQRGPCNSNGLRGLERSSARHPPPIPLPSPSTILLREDNVALSSSLTWHRHSDAHRPCCGHAPCRGRPPRTHTALGSCPDRPLMPDFSRCRWS